MPYLMIINRNHCPPTIGLQDQCHQLDSFITAWINMDKPLAYHDKPWVFMISYQHLSTNNHWFMILSSSPSNLDDDPLKSLNRVTHFFSGPTLEVEQFQQTGSGHISGRGRCWCGAGSSWIFLMSKVITLSWLVFVHLHAPLRMYAHVYFYVVHSSGHLPLHLCHKSLISIFPT